MKKRIGMFGPKIDFDKLEFDENDVYMTNIMQSNGNSYSPIIFKDGTILHSKEWQPICWRGGRGIVKLRNVADETYALIDKNGRMGETQFAKINVNHPVFGFVLYAKNGSIMTFNGDENGNYPTMSYDFKTESGYTTQLRRDVQEIQFGNVVTAQKLNGMRFYYVLVSKEGVLPYEFKSLDKYLGYKCMGYVDKKDKKGVVTLINGNVTLFEGLDVIQAMAISVDYNQFLKLPLSAFEDEKVVKGYMEIAKERIRSEAKTLPRESWKGFQEKISAFNEEVDAMITRCVESLKESREKEKAEVREKENFEAQIDSVGSGISKIYESEKQKAKEQELSK